MAEKKTASVNTGKIHDPTHHTEDGGDAFVTADQDMNINDSPGWQRGKKPAIPA